MSGPQARVRAARLQGWWASVDQPVLLAVLALYALGVLLAFSASPGAAERWAVDNPYYFALRQGVFAMLGVAAMIAISSVSVRTARLVCAGLLAAGLAGVALTLLVGVEVNGARRWLDLGPLSVQPVEFLKVGLIAFGAWTLSAARAPGAPPGGVIVFGLTGLCAAVLLLQPDAGQAILLVLAAAAAAYFAGAPLVWLGALGAAGLAAAGAAYGMLDHVRRRVDEFLAGGGDTGYQAARARAAFAEGGLLGAGPGQTAVTPHLPDAHADFVLAVAAETYGAVAVIAILALLGAVVTRMVLRARSASDPAAGAAGAALATLLGLQAVINIAVTLALAPTKGMTLPFVSYGGSSLLACGAAAGAMLAFTRRRADVDVPAFVSRRR